MGGKRQRPAASSHEAVAGLDQPQADEEKKEKKPMRRNASMQYESVGADTVTGHGKKKKKKVATDGPGKSQSRDSVEPPVGLQIYWNLSLSNEKAREDASLALVNELTEAQHSWEATGRGGQQGADGVLLGASTDDVMPPGCSPAVRYALCRLVRGLASSRETVRQGFAAALAAVLGSLACVEGEAFMKLVNKNLEMANSMKRQEARDVLLGRLFAYGALMRGLKGKDMASELAKEITQQLLSLAAEKSFLREPSVSLLLEFTEPLSSEFLQTSAFAAPLFQEWIESKLDGSSPETLWLALRLHRKLPAAMRGSCALLAGSDDLKQILAPAHLASLVPILKESTCSHPRVHSVWPVFLQLLLSPKNIGVNDRKRKKKTAESSRDDWKMVLKNFWGIVVEEGLLTSSHERKYLAMELLLLLLPNLDPSSVRIVFTGPVVCCLSDVLSGDQSHLHKSAQGWIQEICQWAEQDDERIISVIMSLQGSSGGKFDFNANTQTVKSLTSKLSGEKSCRSFITRLCQLFLEGSAEGNKHSGAGAVTGRKGRPEIHRNGDERKLQDAGEVELTTQDHSSNDLTRIWVLDQIFLVLRVVQLQPEVLASLQKDVLRFLALHGLCYVSDFSERMTTYLGFGKELEWPQECLSERIRTMCLARLSSFLSYLQRTVSSQHTQKNKASEAAAISEALQADHFAGHVIEFLHRVGKVDTISFVYPLSEGNRRSLANLHTALVEVSKALSTCDNGSKPKLKAMHSFFIHLLFQSYIEPGSVGEVVEELLLCCQYLFGQLLEKPLAVIDDEELTNSMDVLVDILLSVLVQPSARIRGAAEQVFRVFCSDLTHEGLQAILRVVRKQPSARYRTAFQVDKEIDEADDAVDLHDDSDGDEGSDEEEEADSGSDENEDGEDASTVLNNLRAKKQGAHSMDRPTYAAGKPQENGFTKDEDESEGEGENLSDMDDEQMFKMDVHLSKILQQRKAVGDGSQSNKDVQSQLIGFKLRALSLLEIFLQRHPSSPLVLTLLPVLLQQIVLTSVEESNSHLTGRIGSVMQNRIFKAKQYPKGSDVSLLSLKELLQKSVNLAGRSANKAVGKIAQSSVLWLLKVLQGTWSESELQNDAGLRVIMEGSLQGFFLKKKCRLPVTFFGGILNRYPWLGEFFVNTLLEQCRSARTGFLQCRALQLLSAFLRAKGGKQHPATPIVAGSLAAALEPHLKVLGDVLVTVFQEPPGKPSLQKEARGYCISCVQSLPKVYPHLLLADVVDVSLLLAAVKLLALPKLKKLEAILEASMKAETEDMSKD